MTDTGERLRQEFSLLDQTRRQLAARTVLKDTFKDLGDPSQEPT
jgi:ATP-dependent Lon protease